MKMLVHLIAYALQVYLIIGVIIALSVQPKGLKKIDPSVEGVGVWLRVLESGKLITISTIESISLNKHTNHTLQEMKV